MPPPDPWRPLLIALYPYLDGPDRHFVHSPALGAIAYPTQLHNYTQLRANFRAKN